MGRTPKGERFMDELKDSVCKRALYLVELAVNDYMKPLYKEVHDNEQQTLAKIKEDLKAVGGMERFFQLRSTNQNTYVEINHSVGGRGTIHLAVTHEPIFNSEAVMKGRPTTTKILASADCPEEMTNSCALYKAADALFSTWVGANRPEGGFSRDTISQLASFSPVFRTLIPQKMLIDFPLKAYKFGARGGDFKPMSEELNRAMRLISTLEAK